MSGLDGVRRGIGVQHYGGALHFRNGEEQPELGNGRGVDHLFASGHRHSVDLVETRLGLDCSGYGAQVIGQRIAKYITPLLR